MVDFSLLLKQEIRGQGDTFILLYADYRLIEWYAGDVLEAFLDPGWDLDQRDDLLVIPFSES